MENAFPKNLPPTLSYIKAVWKETAYVKEIPSNPLKQALHFRYETFGTSHLRYPETFGETTCPPLHFLLGVLEPLPIDSSE